MKSSPKNLRFSETPKQGRQTALISPDTISITPAMTMTPLVRIQI